ncbi:MAG: hypothetical protein LBI78_07705 [Campylobacteraceae bacterium]|jgi:hypothetical protein|nr:hypothetical protein [Campylobacteraceae bacterium]
MTNVGEKGDYKALNFDINELSRDDIIDLNEEMRLEILNRSNGAKIA